MRIKRLLKFFLVFLVLAAIFRLQYSDSLPVKAIQAVFYSGSIQPSVPADHAPIGEKPYYQKDLIRFEILILFLILLVNFAYRFSIFQFKPVRIWIPETEIPDRQTFRKLRNRAPPY